MIARAALLAAALAAAPAPGVETATAPSQARGPRLDPIGETATAPSQARGLHLVPIGDLDALFQKHGAAHGVDWRLLKAVALVESHLNPRAENPDGLSAGIMQIYCRPARSGGCANRFDMAAWPPATREHLYDPDYNIGLGAEILDWNIRRYGLHRGIAAYNQWSARLTPHGQPFPNQYYVDKVLREYRALSAPTRPAGGGAGNTRSAGRIELQLTPPPVTAPAGPRDGLHESIRR